MWEPSSSSGTSACFLQPTRTERGHGFVPECLSTPGNASIAAAPRFRQTLIALPLLRPQGAAWLLGLRTQAGGIEGSETDLLS